LVVRESTFSSIREDGGQVSPWLFKVKSFAGACLMKESYHAESTHEKRRGAVHFLHRGERWEKRENRAREETTDESGRRRNAAITAAFSGQLIPAKSEQTRASRILRTSADGK